MVIDNIMVASFKPQQINLSLRLSVPMSDMTVSSLIAYHYSPEYLLFLLVSGLILRFCYLNPAAALSLCLHSRHLPN